VPIDLDIWAGELRRRWTPLRDQVAFAARRGDDGVGYQEAVPFEVGSVFKAFVAAEYARQVAASTLDPDERVEIAAETRVDSSTVTDQLPDGATISLQEAAEAMIGASDNTATDLVVAAVGVDRVRALVADLGLADTTIPDSTRSLYDRVRAEPGWRPVACRTTMTDLVRFYRATVAGGALGGATARFLALLREEDLLQGAHWPNDATCYRKSGMVEPPPLLAMGMAGAFAVNGEVTAFAFALNVDFPEDAAYEDSPLEPIVRVFSEGLRHGMRALAGAV
jgi:beta-lactamase class A